jgi:hypothetical protein
LSAPPSAPANSSDPDTGRRATLSRMRGWRYRARRARLGTTTALVVVALVVGIAIGRWTAPPPDGDLRRALEQQVLPLALDADGIWTSSSDGRPPVADALLALRRDGDPSPVLASADDWRDAYAETIDQLASASLPPEARPVQRQFIAAITLSSDAVDLLERAATLDDGPRRDAALAEVARLRTRGEQLTQSARTSILDLGGHDGAVTPLQDVPDLPDHETDR